MGHFKLKPNAGSHFEPTVDENGIPSLREVLPGGVIECARNLAEVYPEKFVAVDAPAVVDAAPAVVDAAPAAEKKKRGKQTAPTPTPVPTPAPAPAPAAYTDDVTDSFATAVAQGLLVRGTDATGYNFYEKDMPAEAINTVPLDRAAMEAELLSYVG